MNIGISQSGIMSSTTLLKNSKKGRDIAEKIPGKRPSQSSQEAKGKKGKFIKSNQINEKEN